MQHWPDETNSVKLAEAYLLVWTFFPGSVQGCFASQNVAWDGETATVKMSKTSQIGQIDSLAPFNPRDVTHIENDSLLWFARTGAFLKVAITQRDESISFHSAAAQQTVVHKWWL